MCGGAMIESSGQAGDEGRRILVVMRSHRFAEEGSEASHEVLFENVADPNSRRQPSPFLRHRQ
jgi:hypothetical protein